MAVHLVSGKLISEGPRSHSQEFREILVPLTIMNRQLLHKMPQFGCGDCARDSDQSKIPQLEIYYFGLRFCHLENY